MACSKCEKCQRCQKSTHRTDEEKKRLTKRLNIIEGQVRGVKQITNRNNLTYRKQKAVKRGVFQSGSFLKDSQIYEIGKRLVQQHETALNYCTSAISGHKEAIPVHGPRGFSQNGVFSPKKKPHLPPPDARPDFQYATPVYPHLPASFRKRYPHIPDETFRQNGHAEKALSE